MKTFEISKRTDKNGRRKFKTILYKIFPDSCVDEVNEVGTEYNLNGITWLKEYSEKALPSITGMSLRVEFTDDDRTEILGHGDTGIADGVPLFQDATMIGTFTKGYIDDIETDEGLITACIGEGYIDSSCYHNFCEKLDDDIAEGIYPGGSVEIMRTEDNDAIVYKYGYKDEGRIPTEFIHSGYCLLGVRPADASARLLELNENQKEDLQQMTETEIKTIVSQVLSDLSDHTFEINKAKEECEAKIAEANEAVETAVSEKNEIEANSQKIQEALDALRAEYEELDKKYHALWEEREALEKALGEAKARERLGEMNEAIAEFTDEQKAYAQAEIDAFNADPISSEINSIVSKIYEGIGRAAQADENKKVAEQNAAKNDVEDIFGYVEEPADNQEDINIF